MTPRRLLQAGDTGKAVCGDCAEIVPVTYGYHDLPFRGIEGIARDILGGACDRCGSVVSIPAQSFPHIGYWIERSTPSVILTLSRAELEILDAALAEVHRRLVPEGRNFAFHYALRQLSSEPALRQRIIEALPDFKAEIAAVKQRAKDRNIRVPSHRVRLSASPEQRAALLDLAKDMALSRSDMGRAAILVFREAAEDTTAPKFNAFREHVLAQLLERIQ